MRRSPVPRATCAGLSRVSAASSTGGPTFASHSRGSLTASSPGSWNEGCRCSPATHAHDAALRAHRRGLFSAVTFKPSAPALSFTPRAIRLQVHHHAVGRALAPRTHRRRQRRTCPRFEIEKAVFRAVGVPVREQEWSRGGSNPRPLECDADSAIVLALGPSSQRPRRDSRDRYPVCLSISAAMRLIACSTRAGPAVLGLPASNGGSGAYSMANCVNLAASSPRNFARSTSPKSIPAVTPPPVMRFRSTTTRASTGSAPKVRRASRADQWHVALYPCKRPAAPRKIDPPHTEVTYSARLPRSARNASTS